MKLICRLGWHEYTKWKHESSIITTVTHLPTGRVSDDKFYEIQSRECVHRGIKKMRRERK